MQLHMRILLQFMLLRINAAILPKTTLCIPLPAACVRMRWWCSKIVCIEGPCILKQQKR